MKWRAVYSGSYPLRRMKTANFSINCNKCLSIYMLNVLPYACTVIVYVIVGFNLKYVERPPTEFNDWNYVCVQENKLLMQVKGYPRVSY